MARSIGEHRVCRGGWEVSRSGPVTCIDSTYWKKNTKLKERGIKFAVLHVERGGNRGKRREDPVGGAPEEKWVVEEGKCEKKDP